MHQRLSTSRNFIQPPPLAPKPYALTSAVVMPSAVKLDPHKGFPKLNAANKPIHEDMAATPTVNIRATESKPMVAFKTENKKSMGMLNHQNISQNIGSSMNDTLSTKVIRGEVDEQLKDKFFQKLEFLDYNKDIN